VVHLPASWEETGAEGQAASPDGQPENFGPVGMCRLFLRDQAFPAIRAVGCPPGVFAGWFTFPAPALFGKNGNPSLGTFGILSYNEHVMCQ
jgi:hypothetical protein